LFQIIAPGTNPLPSHEIFSPTPKATSAIRKTTFSAVQHSLQALKVWKSVATNPIFSCKEKS